VEELCYPFIVSESDLFQGAQRRLRPKAYSVAVYVVGLFIFLEIVLLGFIFWFRQSVVETEAPELTNSNISVVSTVNQEEEQVPYLPTPQMDGRIPLGKGSEQATKINKLNDEALKFRRAGDFVLAETALNEALGLDGNHPSTLTNLAMLEEARGNSAKALALWRSILGLKSTPEAILQLAQKRAQLIEDRVRLEEEARQREQQILSLKRKIILAEVKSIPDPLPSQATELQKDFILKLNGLKAPLDSSKLRIQLFFYDMIGENRLAPATKIEAKFLNNTPDWSKEDTEILRARYFPAVEKPGAPPRKYYGYVLRVFYDGELQEEKASPVGLLRLFPQTK
jgi:vacuolar-type H+-ATPase subunit H